MRMELYIHQEIQDRFKSEQNKNALINKLLKDHYAETSTPKSASSQRQTNEPPARSEKIKPTLEKPDKAFTFCKHNQVKGLCRFGCK